MPGYHGMPKRGYQTGGFVPPGLGIGRARIGVGPQARQAQPAMAAQTEAPIDATAIAAADRRLAAAMAQQPTHWVGDIGKFISTITAQNERSGLEERRQRQMAEAIQRQQQQRALAARALAGETVDTSGMPVDMQLKLRQALKEKAVDRFETVENPYGRGGVGQRNVRTGQITGYQGPPKPDAKGKWETVRNEAGLPVAQQNTVTGEVKAHPQASKRDQFGAFKSEQDARKEWKGESKIFVDTQDAFRRVVSSAKRTSPAGDLSLIFNYMKTLDPQSVVRESEFAVAASAGSFGDRVKAAVDQVRAGTRLTADMRADFVETARQAYLGQVDQQNRKRAQFTDALTASGINPKAAALNYIDAPLMEHAAKMVSPAASQEAPAGPAVPRTMVPGGGGALPAPREMGLASLQAPAAPGMPAPARELVPGGGVPAQAGLGLSGLNAPRAPEQTPADAAAAAGRLAADPNLTGVGTVSGEMPPRRMMEGGAPVAAGTVAGDLAAPQTPGIGDFDPQAAIKQYPAPTIRTMPYDQVLNLARAFKGAKTELPQTLFDAIVARMNAGK